MQLTTIGHLTHTSAFADGPHGFFAAALGLSMLVMPVAAHAQPESAADHYQISATFTAWLKAVARHSTDSTGRLDVLAERVATWPEDDLREVLDDFDALDRALARATKRRRPLRPRGTGADGELLSTRETLVMIDMGVDDVGRGGSLSSLARRGVLLHADLAIALDRGVLRSQSLGGTQFGGLTVRDGQHTGFRRRWPHWEMARELWARRRSDPADVEVARRWYVAAAAYMYARGNLVDLLPHIEETRRNSFRADAWISFYGGLLHARMASPTLQHAVRRATLPIGRRPDSDGGRTHLKRAREFLLRAADADSSMFEARVRLGHVLLLLDEFGDAVTHLRMALGHKLDPPIRYYAELFLGGALAGLGSTDQARAAFTRAAALYPHAQSPWLALSRLARVGGDHVSAAALLDRVLEQSPVAQQADDPWHTYYLRDTTTPTRLLIEWRQQLFDTGNAR